MLKKAAEEEREEKNPFKGESDREFILHPYKINRVG